MGIRVITIKTRGGKLAENPQLDQLEKIGLNIEELIEKINKKTEIYKDFDITVRIVVDEDTKEYDIEIKPPSTTSILLSKVGAREPSGDPAHKKIGDLSMEDIIEVALMKKPVLNTKSLRSAVKVIIGSARSIGITIEGKDGKQVTREVDEGLYDEIIAKWEKKWNEL